MGKFRLAAARQYAATAIISFAVTALPWLVWNKSVITTSILAVLTDQVKPLAASWVAIDNVLEGAAQSQNIAMCFLNPDPSNPQQVTIAQQFSVRGSYALYPRRVYMMDDDRTLKSGRDVLEAKFQPDMSWLINHKARGILYANVHPGGVEMQLGLVPQQENR